jgi:hypothetical protein
MKQAYHMVHQVRRMSAVTCSLSPLHHMSANNWIILDKSKLLRMQTTFLHISSLVGIVLPLPRAVCSGSVGFIGMSEKERKWLGAKERGF